MANRSGGGATQALGVAWTMGWPIAAGVGLGYWLDQMLGTSPWLTLLISMAALVGVVRRLIRFSASRTPSGPDSS